MANKFIGGILTAVLVAMFLVVGVYVYSNFSSSIDTSGLSTEAQTAINQTNTNVYKGFQLGSIMPIVLFAGLIIAGIVIGFAFYRG